MTRLWFELTISRSGGERSTFTQSLTLTLVSSKVSNRMDFVTEKRVPRALWWPEHLMQMNNPKFSDMKFGEGSKKKTKKKQQ